MIRTFLQYTLIDIGICDVCYCMDKLEDGQRFHGNWYNQVYFNGYDQSTSTFYFMSYKGEFIDLHIDNIIDIYLTNDSGDDMMRIHNEMYINDEPSDDD